jgi:hypothetical protein
MRVVVTGLIGQYALGGVVWDYLQYLLGFRKLGCDVWYLEDTGMWPYHREREEITADCSTNVEHLRAVMEEFDLGDRWLYRNEPDGHYHGCARDDAGAEKILAGCDILINVSGACWLRPDTMRIKRKIFIDGDPMFTQINLLRDPDGQRLERMKAHTDHFTFGLGIGHANCLVPTAGFHWKHTVQPVDLSFWDSLVAEETNPAAGAWTTVMNWVSYPPVEFEGASYGQKDIEFSHFLDLPGASGLPFVLAMGRGQGNKRPTAKLEQLGWEIHEPLDLIPDHRAYRQFLGSSRGEWSVAKNGYVQARTGWFSCRTACYLAAGRPAVVQDTGWTDYLPCGEGVLAFRTLEEAVTALQKVEAGYEFHSGAARAYAAKYFEASAVCGQLLG